MTEESDDTADVSTDRYTESTCTLSDDDAEARRDWIEEHLLAHLESVEEGDEGVTVTVERSEAAYDAVTTAAWMESNCCSWTTYEIELPPDEDVVRWRLLGDGEEREFFVEGIERVDGVRVT